MKLCWKCLLSVALSMGICIGIAWIMGRMARGKSDTAKGTSAATGIAVLDKQAAPIDWSRMPPNAPGLAIGVTIERDSDKSLMKIRLLDGEEITCISDNWIRADDFVTVSKTVPGNCHDTGEKVPK